MSFVICRLSFLQMTGVSFASFCRSLDPVITSCIPARPVACARASATAHRRVQKPSHLLEFVICRLSFLQMTGVNPARLWRVRSLHSLVGPSHPELQTCPSGRRVQKPSHLLEFVICRLSFLQMTGVNCAHCIRLLDPVVTRSNSKTQPPGGGMVFYFSDIFKQA